VTAPLDVESTEERLDFLALLTPVVEGWRLLGVGAVGLAALVAIVTLLTPRRYRAEAALSPVAGARPATSSLGNLAATLATAGLTGGFQLTPQRLVELIRSRTVASNVLLAPVVEGASARIGDRLLNRLLSPDRMETGIRVLENAIETDIARETGTVTLRAELRDSALARRITLLMVDAASRAFVASAKAQATQLRSAQELRVDSAQTRLHRAEAGLVDFLSRNRQISPFSILSVERDRLQREVTLAQQVYLQAAADREAAVAKELEATPTVVVVDSLPQVLPAARRRLILKTGLALFVGGLIIAVGLMLREQTRQRLKETDPATRRFLAGIRSSPFSRLAPPPG
jgi:uncharacterized protein involved in exopolysaccharide biosynthesis